MLLKSRSDLKTGGRVFLVTKLRGRGRVSRVMKTRRNGCISLIMKTFRCNSVSLLAEVSSSGGTGHPTQIFQISRNGATPFVADMSWRGGVSLIPDIH